MTTTRKWTTTQLNSPLAKQLSCVTEDGEEKISVTYNKLTKKCTFDYQSNFELDWIIKRHKHFSFYMRGNGYDDFDFNLIPQMIAAVMKNDHDISAIMPQISEFLGLIPPSQSKEIIIAGQTQLIAEQARELEALRNELAYRQPPEREPSPRLFKN